MKKQILTALFIGVVFFSCASRKTNTNKIEEVENLVEKKDIKKDSVAVTTSNISYKEFSDLWRFTPIDPTKPMILNGQSFENADVTNEKKEKEANVIKKDSVAKKTVDKSKKDIKKKSKAKIKQVDKDGSNYVFLYFVLGFVILGVAYLIIGKRKQANDELLP